MNEIKHILASEFVCSKCKSRGGIAENLAMSGTGFSRFVDIQLHKFSFVSCVNCGYTEVYNLKVLSAAYKSGDIFEVLFSGYGWFSRQQLQAVPCVYPSARF